MKTRRTANDEVQASSRNVIPLPAASSAQTQPNTPIVKPCATLQATALTRDLIAERAQAIWLKRGCPRNRDEENWREAETQLKTELGMG